jgi:hypothetical protein
MHDLPGDDFAGLRSEMNSRADFNRWMVLLFQLLPLSTNLSPEDRADSITGPPGLSEGGIMLQFAP